MVYILHIRTAFTVRGMSRRYSDFVELDTNLRRHFGNGANANGANANVNASATRIPMLPPKRFLGQLSPEFVQERRRQLQDYLDRLMAHVSTAHSLPVLDFLEVRAPCCSRLCSGGCCLQQASLLPPSAACRADAAASRMHLMQQVQCI